MTFGFGVVPQDEVLAGGDLAPREHPVPDAADEHDVGQVDHRAVEPEVDAGDRRRLQAGQPGEGRLLAKALRQGVFSVFSSDHAPFNYEDPQGKKPGGKPQSFEHIPNGIPGIETRMPLLFDGVRQGRISLHQFVELTSYRPARLYGLYPRKGTIAVGADADIVLWDPEARMTIRNAQLHHAVDYTPYEGREVTGWPVHCFSRGEQLVANGLYLEPAAGRGHFLPAGSPSLV